MYLEMSKKLFDLLKSTEHVKIQTDSDNKYRAEMFLNFLQNITYVNNNVVIDGINLSLGNYFDVRGGKISYHPVPDKQSISDSGTWSREGRQTFKNGKFISLLIKEAVKVVFDNKADLFSPEIKEKLIFRFVEILAQKIKGADNSINIQISENIQEIYETNNAENTGTLAGSCMRLNSSYECSNYSDFYDKLEGVKIAYALNNDRELIMRALIWEGCTSPDYAEKFTFVDRIYGTDTLIETVKDWAKGKGYAHKVEQSYCNNNIILPNGETTYRFEYKFSGSPDIENGVPYMDTLYNFDNYKVSSYQSLDYVLQDCDGQITNNEEQCVNCSYSYDREDMYNIDGEYYCSDCVVNIDGEMFPESECVYSDHEGEYIHEDDAIYSNIMNSYIKYNDAVQIEGTGDYVDSYCASDYDIVEIDCL